jgi:hypothetical protein
MRLYSTIGRASPVSDAARTVDEEQAMVATCFRLRRVDCSQVFRCIGGSIAPEFSWVKIQGTLQSFVRTHRSMPGSVVVDASCLRVPRSPHCAERASWRAGPSGAGARTASARVPQRQHAAASEDDVASLRGWFTVCRGKKLGIGRRDCPLCLPKPAMKTRKHTHLNNVEVS